MANAGKARRHKHGLVHKPLQRIAGNLRTCGKVRPEAQCDVSARDGGSYVHCRCRSQRTSALRLGNDANLPTADQAAGAFEGQFVEAAEYEAVADIVFGEAVIAARIVSV